MQATGKARVRAGFFFAALAALACLGGCISLPQSEALRANPPAGLPARVELTQVPFHLQDDFLCGPASLAMVFNAAGIASATVESLTPMVYLPGRQGSLQAEMLGATRRTGLVAYTLSPKLEDVLREVAAGTPVVVLLNLALKIAPIWHYAVIVGYDLEKREVIVRSAKKPRDEWNFAFLEYFWQDGGYWSMLALPPGRVPATAREEEFAGAIAALEQAGGRREARESYRALLARWPDNLVGLIGLGNVEYALKDVAASERAFRRASASHPTSAVALNNHAHVLAELGRFDDAENAARAAVALGGPTLPEASKTLEAILAVRGRPGANRPAAPIRP
ncbi:MAG: PA2778 family cysteine peptidase [Candidatus Parcubacteria bacterium]|nr:PA2778 family cysteine peptidase [Burkholderiales bacterium]